MKSIGFRWIDTIFYIFPLKPILFWPLHHLSSTASNLTALNISIGKLVRPASAGRQDTGFLAVYYVTGPHKVNCKRDEKRSGSGSREHLHFMWMFDYWLLSSFVSFSKRVQSVFICPLRDNVVFFGQCVLPAFPFFWWGTWTLSNMPWTSRAWLSRAWTVLVAWRIGRAASIAFRSQAGWPKKVQLGGGNSNIVYFHPGSWGKWSNLTDVFFRWVETTN